MKKTRNGDDVTSTCVAGMGKREGDHARIYNEYRLIDANLCVGSFNLLWILQDIDVIAS